MNPTHTILIIGGGIGGLRCAFELDRLLPNEYTIALVDKEEYHCVYPFLYEAAAALPASNDVRQQYHDIRSATALSFTELLARSRRIHFFQREVREIFLIDKVVSFTNHSIARYDYLVIAAGSRTNTYDIAGAEEFGVGFKTLDDALNLRAALGELFDRTPENERVCVTIVGGGFTGVELAGELLSVARAMCSELSRSASCFLLTMIEGRDSILAGLPSRVRQTSTTRLKKMGARLMINTRVRSYDGQTLTTEGGQRIATGLCVWASGIRANPLVNSITGAQFVDEFLAVEPTLELVDSRDAYAIGDIAAIASIPKTERSALTAQKAIAEAQHAAGNIIRTIAGFPPAAMKPISIRYAIPIGGKYAIVDLGPTAFAGIIGWWLKCLIHFKYLAGILPFKAALRHWIQSTRLAVRNDT